VIDPVPDYYRHNFISLLDAVSEHYEDLLNEGELAYMDGFMRLSETAQCLYVRLISRVGPVFRSDKVAYEEIPDIAGAAAELETAGFLQTGDVYTSEELLPLLLKGELVAAANGMSLPIEAPSRLKKSSLIEAFLALDCDNMIIEWVRNLFKTYEPLGFEILSLLKLLFFGNFRQDLPEFILTVLGILTYENYPLEKSARAFSDRTIVDDRIALHNAAVELYEQLPDLTREEIAAFAADLSAAVMNHHTDEQISRRFERLMNELARQLERLSCPGDALELYEKTSLPPSRERQARLHFAAGEYTISEKLCRDMIANPICEEELEFGDFFIGRIGKKIGKPAPRRIGFEVDYQNYQLPGPVTGPVESYAFKLFAAEGYSGFYTENQLWNALFALAFWDIIFMPLDGVFYNRYQRGPADLFTEQFSYRRKNELERRVAGLQESDRVSEYILGRFDEKKDVACSLMNWKQVSRVQISSILSCIPGKHLAAIFSRMARDLRANSSGFPDLVLFPPKRAPREDTSMLFKPEDQNHAYLLVEVKGPGDQVQKNQKRWMKYFSETGIPSRVFRMITPPDNAAASAMPRQ
jgi:hypothetical protein